VIEKKFGAPIITEGRRDVARKSNSAIPSRTRARSMVPRSCFQDSDVAGDGTTTATVLAQAIFREGVKTVAAAPARPPQPALSAPLKWLSKRSRSSTKDVKGEMIAQVAPFPPQRQADRRHHR